MGGVDFPLKGKVRCGNCRRVMAHNFKQAVPTFWCREGLELVGQTQCTSEVFQVSDIENAVFQALKKELSLLDSLYGDIQKEEQDLKEAHKKANRRKTLMEQELKNLKGEKMRMYEEYAAGTLLLDTYKQKKQECDRRIELEIFAEPNPPKRVNRPEACGLRHLAFRVENVEATVEELAQMGIECEPIRLDSYTKKKMTFFFDPDGLPLELHE